MAEEIRILKDFIEKEVPKAPPLYVSVFLMTKAAEGKTSAAEIAEKLEILESDVLKAWRYWEERDCFAKEAAQVSAKSHPIRTPPVFSCGIVLLSETGGCEAAVPVCPAEIGQDPFQRRYGNAVQLL